MQTQTPTEVKVQQNRWTYLLDWMDPEKWRPSDERKCPTRVIKKAGKYIKVVINPSMQYEGNWSPIIEMEDHEGDIYLDHETVPKMGHEWYQTQELAKFAAFEYFWPSSIEDWEGLEVYFTDVDYETEYFPWKYKREYEQPQICETLS